ncbi:zinc-dependent metalloprotease [Lewinellaceae bacterium SD302]|nr:zinc-dependent metalloprotease [Lewinellaceae bacterium SD302]
MLRYLLLTLLIGSLTFPVYGQRKKRKKDAEAEKTEMAEKPEKKEEKKKPYEELIEEADIQDGLFRVITKKGKTYFELDDDVLERELLVVSRISGHVKGLNFGGAGMRSRPQQVIRWQKMGDQILLRSVSYDAVADPNLPVYQSVKNNNFEPVVMSFKIENRGADSTSSVIDATPLFTTDVPMIGATGFSDGKRFGLKGLDKARSLVTKVKAFPQNVEVRHILTYKGAEKLPDNQYTGALSVEMNQSFIELPEDVMQPRLYDPRVGYFSMRQIDYGRDAQRAETQRFITRWRLEPVDMEAWKRGELVDVKKPIVYYIDPATPEQWRQPIMQGVNDWQKTFEAIGLKNAIMAKLPPTKEEDPDWSPEDVRYSVIRYVTTDIQNAMGPHVHDPRSGEILESDIIWYHNVMNLLRNWYLIQTAAVNPAARGVKFEEKVMGELIRFVSAHEVGHTLGLPHNMGSSPAYKVDSLRSPGFVQRMGTAPSIMDYARFNYVAQPEDKGAGIHPGIGPYDYYSIKFGYLPIPEAGSWEAERPVLNAMIREKAGDPIYRYGAQRFRGHDPSAQTEDIGDDPVYASQLGIKNLQRIVPQLIEWSSEDTKFFGDLNELYSNVIGQLNRYSGHVSSNVGGVYEWQRSADEKELVYQPVASERQRAAVKFINEEIFDTPEWLLDLEILQRISPSGVAKRIEGLHDHALGNLFQVNRLNRLVEQRAVYGEEQYGVLDLMNQVSDHIFASRGENSAYRRELQRKFVQSAGALLRNEDLAADAKAATRLNLTKIKNRYANAQAQSSLLAAHRVELREMIDRELEGITSLLEKSSSLQLSEDAHIGCMH